MTTRIGLTGILLLIGCGAPPSGTQDIGSGDGAYPLAGQVAPVEIRSHERIVFGSDSLTTGYSASLPWPTGAGNFIDQVNAILGAGNEITATENGMSGSGIEYLAANLETLIFAPDPTMVILLVGINDALVGTPDFVDKYISVLSRIQAWKPTVKIVCIGIGPHGSEVWARDGHGKPIWNPAQPSLGTYDVYIAQAAAAMGCPFVNWRQRLLAWEVINNPRAEMHGFATYEGTHFTDAGQKQLAAAVLQPSVCTVAP